MENEAELIRQQMTETRTALTEKLETLEEEVASKVKGTTETVAETVETVKEAVEGTVNTVKETVESTVETVKETFDVNRQVERHPWMMFGGAVLLGFVGGRLLARSGYSLTGGHEAPYAPTYAPTFAPTYREPEPPAPPSPTPAGPGLGGRVFDALKPALGKLGGLAIGATAGLVGQMVRDAAPEELRPKLNEVIDDITTALGWTPIHFADRGARAHHTDGMEMTTRQVP
jgi:ElaB/YqjD/DUF883 family membrane-anchored ribosome-binding protein